MSPMSHSLRATPGITALLVLFALAVAGCSRRESPVTSGLRTHTLLLGNGAEPADLDPHLATILTDQVIINALFEGLTVLDEATATPLPGVAASWSASADGLTWTFQLQPNLTWSNGDPLTAADFVASWRRVINPALASENASYLFPLKNAEACNSGKLTLSALGVAAPDPGTLVLTLEQPTPYLPALVAMPAWFPINPKALAPFGGLEKRATAWTRPGNLVSNGAFTLAIWQPNARIELVRNPRHREAATSQLERVVFFPIENPDVEEREFRAGQLHVTWNLPVTKLARWQKDQPARLRADPILQSNFLRFNTTRGPLQDGRVRRALSLAIDRDQLARTVLQGSRAPARSLTPPNTGSYQSTAAVPTDLTVARQLLAAAGFPNGRGLPLLELQCRNDEIMPRLAEALQAIWQRDLGVRTSITQLEQKTWIQNQQSLNYTITTAAWTADFPDPVTFLGLFTGGGAYNWTGWSDAAYDQLLREAAGNVTAKARLELFQRAEARLLESAPIAPLFFGAQTYLIDPAVKGWSPAPLVFRRLQNVGLRE
jgi:oligopeptide transport system substrate-binding protein